MTLIQAADWHEMADVQCDSCGYEQTFEGDFLEILRQMKESGWRSLKLDYGWEHKCSDCV